MNLPPHNMQPTRKLSLPDESLMIMFRKRALTDIVEHAEGKVNCDEEANASVPHPESRSNEDEEKQETQLPQLHQVVLDGNSDLLKELIKNGADINVLDKSGWPPMHTAIRAGKTECAAILIKEGAGEFYYNKQKQDYLKRFERSQKGRKISYWSLMMVSFLSVTIILVSSFSASYAVTNLCEDPVDCDVSFKPLGCFKDKRHQRALPYYIYNERDNTIANYGGQMINWNDWENYLPVFICRCAKKAKEQGYDLFGVQFFGECHAGISSSHHYDRHGQARCKDCIGTDGNDCNERKFCAGKALRNMVYKIVDFCSVRFERIGCFYDKKDSPRLLPSYLLNDRDEQLQSFSGQLIDWENWYEHLPDFICRCAKIALEKGWRLFGIQFWGECWSGPDDSAFYLEGHAQPEGCADQCNDDCACSTRFCAGKNFTNAVYAIREEVNEGSAMLDYVNIME